MQQPDRTFSIGEVAAMVGVSAHTLRAWERRYNVILPIRSAKNQRRYTTNDVRFLAQVSETCADGVRSVKQAVMTVKGELPQPAPPGAELADDQPLWREVIDRSGDPVMILDRRGKIVDANLALLDIVGRAREAIQGRKAAAIMEDEDRRVAAMPLQPADGVVLRLKTPEAVRSVPFNRRLVRQADEWLQVFIGRPAAAAS